MILNAARRQLSEGRDRAAWHLFVVTAGEYLQRGTLEIEGFNAKLETIGDWIFGKYQPIRGDLDDLKHITGSPAAFNRSASRSDTVRQLAVAKVPDAREPFDFAHIPEPQCYVAAASRSNADRGAEGGWPCVARYDVPVRRRVSAAT